MKIAVTTENGMIFQHFGKTHAFTLYEVEGKEVTSKSLLDAGENGHAALADLLGANGVNILICGGIGQGAKDALKKYRIEVLSGVSGNVDQAVKDYLQGTLVYNPDFLCTHHSHEHADHACGGHDCGNHS